MHIRPFEDGDLEVVCRLWRDCDLLVPHNDPDRDIAFARQTPTAEIFVGEDDSGVVATVLAGHDGHRGWLYYLAVAPHAQRAGRGRAMVNHAEAWLGELGVWKVNLMIRAGNHRVRDFYATIGYEEEPRIVMARRLESNHGGGSR